MFLSLSLWTCLVVLVSSAPRPSHPYRRDSPLDDILNSFPNGLINGALGALEGAVGISATYDYVVVGGGTGGVAIATRLAQSGASVAIIEAGGYYEIGAALLANTPGGDTIFVGSNPLDEDPLVDWGFVARDQPGANNRPVHFARGKCLGGSSALNFMIYQRPTIQSMQQWADMVDDQSYTFDKVLPYYKKSAKFSPPGTTRAANASAEYDGSAFDPSGGPLEVSYAKYAQPFSSWMEVGLNAIGINDVDDFNSGNLLGAQYCSSTISSSNSVRSSSEASFLKSAIDADLDNLKVYADTTAQRILFDDNKQATGVEVKSTGSTYTINASKEVVLSAGTFQSPQLLMLSGIGPASTLNSFGIPVLSDLPAVGQNMWDHPTFGPTYPVQVDTLTKVIREPLYAAGELVKYVTDGEGAFSNPVSDYLGWEKLPADLRQGLSPETQTLLAQFPEDWPEIEYLSAGGYVGDFNSLATDQPLDGANYATILTILIAPLSRGNVTLASNNVDDLPIIAPNWLGHPADQEMAVAAYKRARQAFHSSEMAAVVTGPEKYPGENVQSDEDILEAIKNSVMTLWHPACTCRMGNDSDTNAVLDSQARVRGVSGLRVVDASSFPALVPGHPQSTIYMLAEKIADQMVGGMT